MVRVINKNKGSILICLFFFIFILNLLFFVPSCHKSNEKNEKINSSDELKGGISISGAFALYPLTIRWAEEFKKQYPGVRIDISAGGAGKGLTDALTGAVDLGMFSREIMPAEMEKGIWWVAVTKDAVLPTISIRNPVINLLKKRGLTRQNFIDIFIERTLTKWGTATNAAISDKINVYTRSDACGAAGTWAQYLGKLQENLNGVGVYGDPGLADAVKNDPFGIGFNNTIYIYDQTTKKKYEGLDVIPIDINENGQIDEEENFYDSMDEIMNAIALGKYPSPPARDLYFVTKGKPKKEIVIRFLYWILTEGQVYVTEAGYVPLNKLKIEKELDKLD
jgi:phosphate transport system substrate-binding protein